MRISNEIERSFVRKRSFAVMCLGINSFKDVNGEFGTTFGDMLLKQIGSRLKSNFRGDDFVSRMMGDKFLILFSDMKSENDVIAPLQFSDPDFIEIVIEFQKKYGINSEYVEFEITETGIMENEKKTLEIMEQLNSLGFSISIDDFGTGYSSLNKLKDYPIQTLKIDKSFIDSIPENVSSCNIVKTIIDLAHHLGYLVVAEGVEDKEQLDLLLKYDCDLIQGYYYHKPMPQNQFFKLINTQ